MTKADKARLVARDRLVSAIEEAGAALADIDGAFDHADLEEALTIYGLLADLLNMTKDAAAVVGAAAIAVADRWTDYQVPGGGVFKIAGGKERTNYDQEAIISAAAQALTERLELAGVIDSDGESHPAAETVERIVHTTAALAGALAPSFRNWRSGIAKSIGLNLNAYAEIEDAPITHRIEGRSRTTD